VASTSRMNRARHRSDGAATAPRLAELAFGGSALFDAPSKKKVGRPDLATASRNDAQSASRRSFEDVLFFCASLPSSARA
jgi:hypothetical protein